MNAEVVKKLRDPFPPEEVGKLPRVTCKNCRESQGKVCQQYAKIKCDVCSNWITTAHLHLDYVGHAELTDRLLSVDPDWSWEPAAWDEHGFPAIREHRGNLVMWGRLTIGGVTRLGVGTAPANKDDAHKELIGDFLRNAGMRFGVALDLWRKSERHEAEAEHEPEPDRATKEQRDEVKQALDALHPDDKSTLHAWWTEQGFGSLKSGTLLAEHVEPILDEIANLAAAREHDAPEEVAS